MSKSTEASLTKAIVTTHCHRASNWATVVVTDIAVNTRLHENRKTAKVQQRIVKCDLSKHLATRVAKNA